jgi:hypothetical protein
MDYRPRQGGCSRRYTPRTSQLCAYSASSTRSNPASVNACGLMATMCTSNSVGRSSWVAEQPRRACVAMKRAVAHLLDAEVAGQPPGDSRLPAYSKAGRADGAGVQAKCISGPLTYCMDMR